MAELVCLSCSGTSQAANPKVGRYQFPHGKDCKVSDIRFANTVSKINTKNIEPVINTSDAEDTPVPKTATPVKPKAKRKIVPKKTESA